MNTVLPAIGCVAAGIVIGWLVRSFIWRIEKFTPSVLNSIIAIAFGGGAVQFAVKVAAVNTTIIWFYPIGILVGFVIYQVIVMTVLRKVTQEPRDKRQVQEKSKKKSEEMPIEEAQSSDLLLDSKPSNEGEGSGGSGRPSDEGKIEDKTSEPRKDSPIYAPNEWDEEEILNNPTEDPLLIPMMTFTQPFPDTASPNP